MIYDETWLRERGYQVIGDSAIRMPQQAMRLGTPDDDTPESTLLATVRHIAKAHGYIAYHTRDARGSDCGFPDLVWCKPGHLIFAELKSTQGKLTMQQQWWLSMLAHSIPAVEVYLWYPADWLTIQEVLRSP